VQVITGFEGYFFEILFQLRLILLLKPHRIVQLRRGDFDHQLFTPDFEQGKHFLVPEP
jgi:hypothetical protein